MLEGRATLLVPGAGGALASAPLRAPRSGEAAALTGWRGALATAIELLDAATPWLAAGAAAAGAGVHWLLGAVLGRGLGALAAGVREGLTPRWARGGGGGGGGGGWGRQGVGGAAAPPATAPPPGAPAGQQQAQQAGGGGAWPPGAPA